MKNIQKRTGVILLGVGLAMGSTASAATMADIQLWIGEGINQAALVIDWDDGRAPYLWGYRWDGPVSGEEMMSHISFADPRLGVKFVLFGDSVFYNEFSFDADLSGTYLSAEDRASRSDPFFVNEEFWGLFHSSGGNPYAGGTWVSSQVGVSDLGLVDGMWVGFRYGTWPVGDPGEPIAVSVPEPSGLLLSLVGGGILLLRCRRVRFVH